LIIENDNFLKQEEITKTKTSLLQINFALLKVFFNAFYVDIYINTTNILFIFHNKIESFKTYINVFPTWTTRIPHVVQVLTTHNKREKKVSGNL
jgi:hypothetical protein